MELTKKLVYKYSYKLWKWLAENPDKQKHEFFEIKKIKKPLNTCYACEYALNEAKRINYDGNMCFFCPMLSLWGVSYIPNKSYKPCVDEQQSPYISFTYGCTVNQRIISALIIKNFCELKLDPEVNLELEND